MPRGNLRLVSMFLLVFAVELQAQWESGPWLNPNPDGMDRCRDLVILVRNSMGAPITGAVVTMEDFGIPYTTDSQGAAVIPCHTSRGFSTRMEIRAPGYKVSKITIPAGSRSRLDVVLDERGEFGKAAGNAVNVQELYSAVQAESQNLQTQAVLALRRKDYDKAEELLLRAEQLTPSAAAIANDLGIVALGRNNLNLAGSWFEKAVKISPYQADTISNLGLIRWMQRRTEESYRLVKTAASMGYETSLGNYILGTVGLGQGLNKEAAERLKKTPPDRFPYRDLYLSIALRNLGKTKAADDAFRKFLKRNPAPFKMASHRLQPGAGPR